MKGTEAALLEDREPVAIGLLGAAAVGLRLHDLTGESLINDEFHTIHDLRTFSTAILEQTGHGRPLYYAFMKAWTAVAGYSEVSLRLPSVLFGVGTVLAIYALGRELADRRVGLGAASLIAMAPFFVTHAQQARMYALLPMLTALSTLALVRLLRGGVDRRRAAAYVAVTGLLGLTHVYGLLVIAGHTVYLAVARAVGVDLRFEGRLRDWIGLQATLALTLAPVLLAILYTLTVGDGGGADGVLPWNEPPGAYRLVLAIVRPIHFTRDVGSVLLVGVGVLAVLGVGVARAPRDAAIVLPLTLAVWSIAVAFVLSHLVTPIFLTRYLSGVGALLVVALVAAVDTIETPELEVAVVILVVLAVLSPLPAYYAETDKQQWRQGAAMLEDAADGDDRVLAAPPHTARNVRYYYDGPAEVRPLDVYAEERTVRSMGRSDGTLWLVAFESLRRTQQLREVSTVLARDRTVVAPGSGDDAAPGLSEGAVRPYRTFIGFDVYRFDPPDGRAPSGNGSSP